MRMSAFFARHAECALPTPGHSGVSMPRRVRGIGRFRPGRFQADVCGPQPRRSRKPPRAANAQMAGSGLGTCVLAWSRAQWDRPAAPAAVVMRSHRLLCCAAEVSWGSPSDSPPARPSARVFQRSAALHGSSLVRLQQERHAGADPLLRGVHCAEGRHEDEAVATL